VARAKLRYERGALVTGKGASGKAEGGRITNPLVDTRADFARWLAYARPNRFAGVTWTVSPELAATSAAPRPLMIAPDEKRGR